MPLSIYSAIAALDGCLPQGTALTLTLLSASPGNSPTGLDAYSESNLQKLSIEAWPTCSSWAASDNATFASKTNGTAVSFGTVTSQITVETIGIFDANQRLVAWAPLASEDGVQAARSFRVGEAITLPIGALSVSI